MTESFKNLPIGYSLNENFRMPDYDKFKNTLDFIKTFIKDHKYIKGTHNEDEQIKDYLFISSCGLTLIGLSRLIAKNEDQNAIYIIDKHELDEYVKSMIYNIAFNDKLNINEILDECSVSKNLYNEFMDDIIHDKMPRNKSKEYKITIINRMFNYYIDNKFYEFNNKNMIKSMTLFLIILLLFYNEISINEYTSFKKPNTIEEKMWKNIIRINNTLIKTRNMRLNHFEDINKIAKDILNHKSTFSVSQNGLFYTYINTIIPIIMYYIIIRLPNFDTKISKDEIISTTLQFLKQT